MQQCQKTYVLLNLDYIVHFVIESLLNNPRLYIEEQCFVPGVNKYPRSLWKKSLTVQATYEMIPQVYA